MDRSWIFCPGRTPASRFAAAILQDYGLPVASEANAQVGHLLLDVPSFEASGQLRMGGAVETLLASLPGDVIVYGGNLNHPALAGYRTVDFLQDGEYLAQNAYITAECALDVALPYLSVTLRGCPVLIIGWGRIGKCLGQLLKAIGADVTIAARKPADRFALGSLGYKTADPAAMDALLPQFRLMFNTAPDRVLDRSAMAHCRKDCVKIELASRDGMDDEDVIIARGLPGIHMPESSGALIAKTFLSYYPEGGL